jgi:glycosyltransferase involved in cell wall biosynthesis
MFNRTRVLIPIAEPIGGQMSAVGIRQFEVGKALAAHCEVTFASSAASNDIDHGIPVAPCRGRGDFHDLLESHDVLYTLGLNSDRFLDVVRSRIRVVLDIYTPLAYEILESWPELPTPLLSKMHRRVVRWTDAQLSRADFIVCTNEKQRDMWLGALNSIGRVTADETRRNPNCRQLIDVAAFGIPERPPIPNGHPIRSRLPKIAATDFVLLWSSKILAWQDPVTLLRAMQLLKDDHPTIRLVFLGIGPMPQAGKPDLFDPASLRTREAVQAAADMELTDKSVFFITDRIPYREIGGFYLDADAAVATYPDSLETRFCLGSRILDYVWAGLPMVISGDKLQREFVEGQRLGIVVQPGDPEALADAIRRLKAAITGGGIESAAFDSARERLKWSVVTQPIIDFCKSSAARTRRERRKLWSARLQLAEFVFRSLAIRARMYFSGIAKR